MPGLFCVYEEFIMNDDILKIVLDKVEIVDTLKDVVTSIRTIRSELNIAPSKKIDVLISINDKSDSELFQKIEDTIIDISRIEKLKIDVSIDKPKKSAVGICKKCVIYVPLGDLVDTKSEVQRLEKRLREIEDLIASIKKKLDNKSFVDNAPIEIVNHEKNKLMSNYS